MHWPPNKAFTSTSLQGGYRHFVVFNYGGNGRKRWVNLVAVLDGNIRFKVSWEELKDPNQWTSGWLQLPRDSANPPSNLFDENNNSNKGQENLCLHPSEDSGLRIPTEISFVRPWFEDDNF